MPSAVIPEAVTAKVMIAASRVSGSFIAAFSAAPSAPSSARPATASISSGGDAATKAVANAAPRPSTKYATPPATEAIQRRSGSAWASGPATSAAVIAARFTAKPPKGAAAMLAAPVVVSTGRRSGS